MGRMHGTLVRHHGAREMLEVRNAGDGFMVCDTEADEPVMLFATRREDEKLIATLQVEEGGFNYEARRFRCSGSVSPATACVPSGNHWGVDRARSAARKPGRRKLTAFASEPAPFAFASATDWRTDAQR